MILLSLTTLNLTRQAFLLTSIFPSRYRGRMQYKFKRTLFTRIFPVKADSSRMRGLFAHLRLHIAQSVLKYLQKSTLPKFTATLEVRVV